MKKLLHLLLICILLTQPFMVGAATDVKNDATLSTNLQNYWELESIDGGTTADSHGTFDLTDNNSVTITSTDCAQNNCGDFTPNDNFSITEQSELRFTGSNNLSTAFCFNADSVTGVQGLVGMYNGNSTSEEWLVYLNGTSLILAVRNKGAAVTWSGTVAVNTDYCVVATMSSSNAYELYVSTGGTADGTPDTGSAGNGASDVTLTFRIGAYGITPTGYFNGTIDEVGIWSKVLSSSEVSDLYNSGSYIPYDAGGAGGGVEFIWSQVVWAREEDTVSPYFTKADFKTHV